MSDPGRTPRLELRTEENIESWKNWVSRLFIAKSTFGMYGSRFGSEWLEAAQFVALGCTCI